MRARTRKQDFPTGADTTKKSRPLSAMAQRRTQKLVFGFLSMALLSRSFGLLEDSCFSQRRTSVNAENDLARPRPQSSSSLEE